MPIFSKVSCIVILYLNALKCILPSTATHLYAENSKSSLKAIGKCEWFLQVLKCYPGVGAPRLNADPYTAHTACGYTAVCHSARR